MDHSTSMSTHLETPPSAVKGGAATERSEAPLTGEGSAVARLPSGSGRAPLPSWPAD